MSRSRSWCFTLNNPDELLGDDTFPGATYVIYQEEMGNTYHFQGYVYWPTLKSLTQMQAYLPRAHWEVARGSPAQNTAYCSKSDTRLGGPYVYGVEPSQGKRSDLENVRESIDSGRSDKELWDEHFPQMVRYHRSFKVYASLTLPKRSWAPHIVIMWGPPGTGKTHTAYDMDEGLYKVPPKKGSGLYFDGYDRHETMLFDEFTGQVMTYNFLKQLLDQRELQLPVHGGTVQCVARNYVFTSNFPPDEWYQPGVIGGAYADSPLAKRLARWGEVIYFGLSHDDGTYTSEEDYRARLSQPPLVPDAEGVLWPPNFN